MPSTLTESGMFALLSERYRRLTLEILQESTTPLSVSAVARAIEKREDMTSSTDDIETISLALSHNHLPRLDDADVVVYDGKNQTVYPGLNFDSLTRLLDQPSERDLPWNDESRGDVHPTTTSP